MWFRVKYRETVSVKKPAATTIPSKASLSRTREIEANSQEILQYLTRHLQIGFRMAVVYCFLIMQPIASSILGSQFCQGELDQIKTSLVYYVHQIRFLNTNAKIQKVLFLPTLVSNWNIVQCIYLITYLKIIILSRNKSVSHRLYQK